MTWGASGDHELLSPLSVIDETREMDTLPPPYTEIFTVPAVQLLDLGFVRLYSVLLGRFVRRQVGLQRRTGKSTICKKCDRLQGERAL